MNTAPKNWRECYLTVAQAADVVNMTKKALYNRINRGEGPQLARIGRSIRIPGESLVAWLESCSTNRSAEPPPPQNKRNGSRGGNNEC